MRTITARHLLVAITALIGVVPPASSGPEGPWCGMPPCGRVPQVFAPDLIGSDAMEYAGSFTPDGQAFYFTRRAGSSESADRIWWTRRRQGRWLAPELAPFAHDVTERQPHVTPDGGRLYFLSARASQAGATDGALRLWAMDRVETGWSEPFCLDHADAVSAAADGSLYLARDGVLLRRELTSTGFEAPAPVSLPLMSAMTVAHPFVAPDESLLLFEARANGRSDADLYVCHRRRDRLWSAPIRLPDPVNTPADEFAVSLSPDGRCLFFARTTATGTDIWWVSARILEDLVCGP